MIVAATLVDWDLLGQAVLASVVVGICVLVVAGFAVVASLRAQDERAAGHESAVVTFSAVTILCIALIVGAIVAGIYVMTL